MSIKEHFTKEQLARDALTDKLLVPFAVTRYASYAVAGIGSILSVIGLWHGDYKLVSLGLAIAGLVACLYGIKAYQYIQDKEDEQKGGGQK